MNYSLACLNVDVDKNIMYLCDRMSFVFLQLSNQVISVQEIGAATPRKYGGAAQAQDDSTKSSEQLLEIVRYGICTSLSL